MQMGELRRIEERELLIGGKWVEASGGTYEILNPATEQPVGEAPGRDRGGCRGGSGCGPRGTAGLGGDTPATERLALMAKAAEAIKEKAADLVPLVIAETGATAGGRVERCR